MACAPLGPHVKHSRHYPCPRCGKDNCITFADGGTLCLRTESPRRTPSGIGWYHPSDGDDWRDGLYPPPPPPERPPEPPPPDPVLVDRGLRFIVDRSPVSPAHREELHRRGLTDAHVDAGPFGTLPDDGPARDALAAALVAELGPVAYGNVPGLYADETTGAPRLNAHPGLMVGVEQDGRLVGITIRPDDPAVRADGKYRHLSSPPARYPGGAASGAPAGVVFPTGWEPGTPVERAIVAEGVLKGYVAANKTGLPTIVIPGATITADVARLAAQLGATEIVLAFDNDRTTNEKVARAEAGLAEELIAAGFPVLRATWPAAWKGIDDALAAGVLPLLEPYRAADEPVPAACSALLAAKDAELAEVKRANRALLAAMENPHWKPTEKVALVRAVRELDRERRRGPTPDGRYRLSPARVALDFRKEKGATVNPSGTTPVMSKATAIGALQTFAARGIIDERERRTPTKVAKVHPVSGVAYTDQVPVKEKWVAFVDPTATIEAFAGWRPDRPKQRKPREAPAPRCPHCGGTHRRTTCLDCGVILAETPPPAAEVPRSNIFTSAPASAAEDAPAGAPRTRSNIFTSAPAEEPEEPARLGEAPAPDAPDAPDLAAARGLLAAADHAQDADELHRATADLAALLEPVARAKGGTPVPKSPRSQPHPWEAPEVDRWTW